MDVVMVRKVCRWRAGKEKGDGRCVDEDGYARKWKRKGKEVMLGNLYGMEGR